MFLMPAFFKKHKGAFFLTDYNINTYWEQGPLNGKALYVSLLHFKKQRDAASVKGPLGFFPIVQFIIELKAVTWMS